MSLGLSLFCVLTDHYKMKRGVDGPYSILESQTMKGGSVKCFIILGFLCAGFTIGFGKDVQISEVKCIEEERQALLKFKHGLLDPDNLLASWDGLEDCCKWKGIGCSNQTGHVIQLDLPGHYMHFQSEYDRFGPYLQGEISSSLLGLQHLTYLDLSSNNFSGKPLPAFLGSFPKLQHLSLYNTDISGAIPRQLGNLSTLISLDLSWNDELTEVHNLDWLSQLYSLEKLDMAGVNLSQAVNWPDKVNRLPSIIDINLVDCQLSMPMPPVLPNANSSSTLSSLDLSSNSLSSSIFPWLFNYTSLVDLMLYSNDLRGPIPDAFGRMNSLRTLELVNNQLQGGVPKSFWNLCTLSLLDLEYNNLSGQLSEFMSNTSGCMADSLEGLYLDGNKFTGPLPDNIGNMSNLIELSIDKNFLEGVVPDAFGRMNSLRTLDLHHNQLEGGLPKSFWNLCTLSSLHLEYNNLSGQLSEFMSNTSGCMADSLEGLYLDGNKFTGPLPGNFGNMSNLTVLSVVGNFLEGVVSETHFSNLSKLQDLSLGSNSLRLNFSFAWKPPFQLDTIHLRSCKMGPAFPKWLQSQNKFTVLDISDAGISDTVPAWFWDKTPRLLYLNMSCNQLHGKVPDLSSPKLVDASQIHIIDLSHNLFEGSIPTFPSNMLAIFLSSNRFSGSVSFLCALTEGFLNHLDLSNNMLSGDLPDCWIHFTWLYVLSLSNNNLSGEIPSSMGSLIQIRILHLGNNSFVGKLPLSLQNCTRLVTLDVSENHLSETVPAWIGDSLPDLFILKLRSNLFYGSLPLNLCHLAKIQILDLSLNNITGTIPKCINNLTAMSQKQKLTTTTVDTYLIFAISRAPSWVWQESTSVVWKGTEYVFRNYLQLLKIINLSGNKLIGEIPEEITSLTELVALNLSGNNITGVITPKIGLLRNLQSLDLSKNQLRGEIPGSFSDLSFLSRLNLSENNLSGKIPTATQLQTFDASAFMGNPDLCGPPLPKKCRPEDPSNDSGPIDQGHDVDDGFITGGFYVAGAVGFVVGFWGVSCSLVLNLRYILRCLTSKVRVMLR